MDERGSFFIVLLRFPYLLFHYNDNKLSNEAQKKARSNTVPQRHKGECQKVWEKFISKETEPFVQIPSGENKMTISVSGDPRKLQWSSSKFVLQKDTLSSKKVMRIKEMNS